ncbi:MAG: energy transducer TonB [Flavobacteriales bacterium]|nr:energy transducer TonB [Flavobacteriales bacterium]
MRRPVHFALPFVLALSLAHSLRAQETEEPSLTIVEVMPEFPGGQEAMYKYLGKEVEYPDKAIEAGIQGVVYVNFIIEKEGTLSHARILRGASPLLDAEALRVVQGMPKWTPGMQLGKPVRVQYNLPIRFVIHERKKRKRK